MTDEDQSELDKFAENLEAEAEEQSEDEPKPEKKPRKKTKKKRSKKSKPRVESPLEARQRIIHEFIQKHQPTCSLEQMIVIFAREQNCPRLLSSEIRYISANRNPYHILDYMYSQRN